MQHIELCNIEKKDRKIEYVFKVSSELNKYFSGVPFIIEYPDSIENVPDAVLAIPFVANVLPLSWLSNSELIIPELDTTFYESINVFKAGFVDMYPEASFGGKITVGSVKDCSISVNSCNSAVLFSGGLDAMTTTLRHYNEKPMLVSIWGADIRFENEKGWKIVESGIKHAADSMKLQSVSIHSTFREFDVEGMLDRDFSAILQRGWWYGVKHGIGIICHVAPYAYKHKINRLYIASSNCTRDGIVRCASDPRIDNNVTFCGCEVIHDNYESTRQQKTEYLVKYRKDHSLDEIPLHVCWKSNTGTNCAHCEKCYRTMVGFWIAGDDPINYGFTYNKNVFKDIYRQMALTEKKYIAPKEWTYMKEALNRDWNKPDGQRNRRKLRWMKSFDFHHPDSNLCRKRRALIKRALVKMNLYKFTLKVRSLTNIRRKESKR